MQRIHLVGARGAGMQALAAVLAGRGCRLTGSDLLEGTIPSPGGGSVPIACGHHAEHLPTDADLLVYSDAVTEANPELRRAVELGIPCRSYFQTVGQLTGAMQCLAVAGTHGKSSTVAMASQVFTHAGRDPLVFCGAARLGAASAGRFGQGPIALVEACEFRANFLHLQPQQAAVLGIDHDHFDCYPQKQDLLDAFTRFVQTIPPQGLLIARADCADTQRVAARAACRVETFARTGNADWLAGRLTHRDGCYAFELVYRGRPACEIRLQVPGAHNVRNALAAAALAHANGIAPECIGTALSQFAGLSRRLERLGTYGDIAIIDDYAHHPTEITAALQTIRQMHPGRRLWCVYQPHQALRLTRLLAETADSLQAADAVVVADVFRAREGAPIPGEADAAQLAVELQRRGVAAFAPGDAPAIVSSLATQLKPGDVLATLGAGDLRAVAEAAGEAIARPGTAPRVPHGSGT